MEDLGLLVATWKRLESYSGATATGLHNPARFRTAHRRKSRFIKTWNCRDLADCSIPAMCVGSPSTFRKQGEQHRANGCPRRRRAWPEPAVRHGNAATG